MVYDMLIGLDFQIMYVYREANQLIDILTKVSLRYISNGGINKKLHKEFNKDILLISMVLLLLCIIGVKQIDE